MNEQSRAMEVETAGIAHPFDVGGGGAASGRGAVVAVVPPPVEALVAVAAVEAPAPRRKRGRPFKDDALSKRLVLSAHDERPHQQMSLALAVRHASRLTWRDAMPLPCSAPLAVLHSALTDLDTLKPDSRLQAFDVIHNFAFGDRPRKLLASQAEAELCGFDLSSHTRVRE